MAPYTGPNATYEANANDMSQDVGERGERGYRRRKLAAMAGNLYKSGQQAVTDFRDSYAQSRIRASDDFGTNESTHIPGAFPDVAITSQGNEQMVLFPSYGKHHCKRDWARGPRDEASEQTGQRDEDWWRQEWERHEDEKAVVDVDVRGWIYSPHVGPMTRRNRILIGLARQLSGIPAPRPEQAYGSGGGTAKTQHQIHEERHDQEKIEHEAAVIETRGQEEKRVAYSGGYSEQPEESNNVGAAAPVPVARHGRGGKRPPDSAPASPKSLPTRAPPPPAATGDLSDGELAVANANLMARVAPFLTNPLVALPITIFFYNEIRSQSKTVLTNDAGHFNVRAALDFVPTHVRVLANEKLSTTQEVRITEPTGVSLISDIDDTIKRSNISGGAREIFRNTFVRDLKDLCIDGVREWYTHMHGLGVSMHYCSNSPWQLFPLLASFFKIAGLPPGSLHLKKYSGMLQGIFEPVAERKKTTLNRLMKDFPGRKFLLVGDSGEADLEVYTELSLANPGRVLAIFIRDVTTPEMAGYFDSAVDLSQRQMSNLALDDGASGSRGLSAGRQDSMAADGPAKGPAMGTLIDLSPEPEAPGEMRPAAPAQVTQSEAVRQGLGPASLPRRKPPPPRRPAKPAALRSVSAQEHVSAARRPDESGVSGLEALTRAPGRGDEDAPQRSSSPEQDPPPPPLPRRRPPESKGMSPRRLGRGAASASEASVAAAAASLSLSNADVEFEALPPPMAGLPPRPSGPSCLRPGGPAHSHSFPRSGSTTPSGSPTLGAQGVSKKLELWRRRLERAHEQLSSRGVALYTWRTGHDVVAEAVGIVKDAQEQMNGRRR